MAGFLDPKERFLDIQLTQEGKRQLAQGKIRIEYASFTDAGVVYSTTDQFDSGSFTELNTKRLFFEAGSRPQDTIIYESDDSGMLKSSRQMGLSGSRDTFRVKFGQIYTVLSGAISPISSSVYETLSSQILSTSYQNLKDLKILQSPSFEDINSDFKLSTNEIAFTITRKSPFNVDKEVFEIDINHADSMFVDKRLSRLPNFKFLPPINKKKTSTPIALGIYPSYGVQETLTSSSLTKELKEIESKGQKQTIYFSETTPANTILGQFVEVNGGVLRKLDIIDFGEEPVNDPNDPSRTRHVYFAGKLYLDDNGTHTFINIFTLVFGD
jgi:hypothetical protein